MTAEDVVALVDDRASAAGAVRAAALAGFTRPASVREFGTTVALAAAVRGAIAAGATWIWLLDGRAVPDDGALRALLDAAAVLVDCEPPLVLSSVVTTPGETLHPAALAQHEIFEKDRTVRAAGRGLVHLRAAGPGSLLVSRAAGHRFPVPVRELAGDLHLREWTVRMLRAREDTGYLVPASRAVRSDPGPSIGALWPARLRLLASPGWSGTERLWEAYRLAMGAPGARPSRNPRRTTAPAAGAK